MDLDKIRLEDIEFFARRYSELYGEYFGNTTPQDKEKFYREIKNELLIKAPKYVISDTLSSASGISLPDRIEFSKEWLGFENRHIRIHELFHSYNRIEKRISGLRELDSDVVLASLDEGCTEMFAREISGIDVKEFSSYNEEVKITRFLTSLVGKKTVIQASRGNPKLLSDSIDSILGTHNFLGTIEQNIEDRNKLINMIWNHDDIFSYSEEEQLLANLKFETIRNQDATNMLFDAVQSTNNYQLYQLLEKTDRECGYNTILFRDINASRGKADVQNETLAMAQQRILKSEIEELEAYYHNGEMTHKDILERTIKMFLYDKISFQKNFTNSPASMFETYELNQEQEQLGENFCSDLDGANTRFGKFGIYGAGFQITSLGNTPFLIDKNIVKNMSIPNLALDELQDYRLDIWAEKLNIAQMKSFLDKWDTYVYNDLSSTLFSNVDRDFYDKVIEEIKKELDQKEAQLLDKYRQIETSKKEEKKSKDEISNPSQEEKNLDGNKEKEVQQKETIRQIEKLLNFNITNIGMYVVDPNKHNGIPYAQLKDTSQLRKEQGEISTKIDELLMEGEIDPKTRAEMKIALITEYNKMVAQAPKPSVATPTPTTPSTPNDEYEQKQQQFPTSNSSQQQAEKVESIDDEYRRKYNYDSMSHSEKVAFDKKLEEQKKKIPILPVEKTEKEKLEEQRRNLRRQDYEAKRKAMGLDPQDLTFEEMMRQQEIIEKMNKQKVEAEEIEEVEHHGMSM